MKKKSAKKQSKKTVWYLLSDLCTIVNDAHKSRAIDEYLKGELHMEFIIAGEFSDRCRELVRNLRAGRVEPHLTICCCKDTFKNILAAKATAPYVSYAIDTEDLSDEEAEDRKRRVIACPSLDGQSPDEIEKILINCADCCALSAGVAHSEDVARAHAYHQAVLLYLETAAAVAKGRGSQSARLFLEAIRLLTPRDFSDLPKWEEVERDDSSEIISRLNNGIHENAADRAYELACEAQGALWVDLKAAELKPIVAPRRGKKTSKR